jgi:arylsulfatase A-like enzyme/Flp pilus assembly protein TadD
MEKNLLKKVSFFCVILLLIIVWGVYFFRRIEPLGKNIRNVLLVSIDTCRADYLSSYGYPKKTTPNIDRLAGEGVLFENAITPVPQTLPGHSSMLTGTIPPYHGVHDNNGYQLGESNITLAEILNEKGFSTAGFISAYVLDSQFGIDQGFETYNDRFEEELNSNGIDERRAEEVSRLAMKWLDGHKTQPFFMFLHYFDPHMKYDPPEPFASEFSNNLYAGEIAYTDYWIGKVIEKLKESGLYDSTLVVITADHGEMLGEHREVTHAYYIYQGNIHVPLIIKVPGCKAARKITQRVGIVDILPTICGLLDIKAPSGIQGKDLSNYIRGDDSGDERYLFCESLYPTIYKCNSLLGVVTDRYKYIQTTRPELYDLVEDPGEENNLIEQQPQRARILQSRLKGIIEETIREPGRENEMAMDELSKRRLESLGYVGGKVAEDFSFNQTLEDPKDLIDFNVKFNAIPNFLMSEDYETAKKMYLELLEQRPDFAEAYIFLARISNENQNYEHGLSYLLDAVKIEPMNSRIHKQLGKTYANLGKYEDAIRHYRESIRLGFEMPGLLNDLGKVLAKAGKSEEAARQYEKAIQIDPDFTDAHHNLGGILQKQKKYDQAIAHYTTVLELKPDEFKTHHDLAAAYFEKGSFDEAVKHLTEVFRLDPENGRAYRLMGRVLSKQGKIDEAITNYLRSLEIDPDNSQTRLFISQLLQFKGEFDKAAVQYQALLEQNPDQPDIIYELAGVRFRQRKFDEAVVNLKKILDLMPGDIKAMSNIARAYYHLGQFEQVIETWGRVLEIKPEWPEALNAQAWILATCRDQQYRDPQAALKSAGRACELSEFKNASYLLTLAAAHSANGDFDEGIKFAEKAKQLAQSDGDERIVSEADIHLELYSKQQPYHAKYKNQ